MITKIKINNFQSHVNSVLELDKGVNVIVGSSDSGKSAIIRALKWVLFNKPKGDSYRNWNGEDTRVSLEFEEHSRVIRFKSNSENLYILENEKNTLSFAAFGHDIPNEILREVNITEVNFQAQSDSPYLISSTSGEVAQHFNRMAGIEKIDLSRQRIQTKLNSTTSSITSKTEQKKQLFERIEQFDYLVELENYIEEIEKIEITTNKMDLNLLDIKSVVSKINELEVKIKYIQDTLKSEVLINEISIIYQQIDTTSEDLSNLKQTRDTISKNQELINELTLQVQSEKLVQDIEKDIEIIEKIKNKVAPLTYIIQQMELVFTYIDKNKKILKANEELYANNIGDICPLCEQEIK